ncbi:c-type cytochrome [Hydrogenophaga sp. ZJX-1]|uniref:c-type cytochrome n=1 Tax=Hydrogenophaga sp. ZJX-1 TaxID=3404778 RepID=UPI003B28DAD8
MKNALNKAGVVAVGLSLCSGLALAQPSNDLGKIEFVNNCAACHGVDGKGNGPLGNLLQRSPPDLTMLAKNNNGVLPMNRLYQVMDGVGVPSHGARDMPIWGKEYLIEESQKLREARGSFDAPAVVRARILTLLEYISRIQVR